MSKGFNRILLAVRDIDELKPALLRKVAALAGSARTRLEVYHAIAEPVVLVPPRIGRADFNYKTVLATSVMRSTASLERQVAKAKLQGVVVSCRVDWDYPAFAAILRRAATTKADLVVAVVRKHLPTARVFLRNVDWELIRNCPVPLLLVKSTRPYRRPGVLVAVDPLHAADKPARLDRLLLATGSRMAAALRGNVQMVHGWQPLSVAVPPMPGMPGPLWVPQDAEDQHSKTIEKAFSQLARAAAVAPNRRHLLMGSVADAFASAVRRSRAQIMVMGAISRRGVARLLIGNTAERMLDQLPCDVLVVKPQGFKNKISRKPRGPNVSSMVLTL